MQIVDERLTGRKLPGNKLPGRPSFLHMGGGVLARGASPLMLTTSRSVVPFALRAVVTVKHGRISFLSANPRSTFDSAAHFYGGDTTSLTLPAAIPADSLVCLGPNLLLARFNCRGFFGECFIPSTTDTSEHNKTPIDLLVGHNRPLAPEEYGANLTVGFRPTTGVE